MVQMESSRSAKRLWRMVRVVLYMIRKSFFMHKLMMDLHLLLKRGKIASKALVNLVTFHHQHHHYGATVTNSGFSCRSMDPDRSFYSPREVQFSCSSTPSYPFLHAIKRRSRHRRYDYDYDAAAAMAEAFERLEHSEPWDAEPVMASPSPAPMAWDFGRSPAGVRQLTITDSPFPLEEEEAGGRVDQEAEQFIKRFYEQLRLQQVFPGTPEYGHRRHEPLMGRA
ncbi:Avr9 Cf-9 rapidly elicited protein 146 [Musa troglodytarum]|uniref:Avr9 Cf-9 rapidly elicited protein 146 n=1 Tax=Musa troglodytarum TaxID=320322 RepID=A0A9E7KRW8_9LILI|nr:Avr9 Cf-9 rapidly elicited protein 146 [Musa troglodytarum]